MSPNNQAKGQRLDAALVLKGIATSRERAKLLIQAGEVLLNGKVMKKASALVLPGDVLICEGESLRYVGRGGLKLEKAIELSGYQLNGLCALDIGASTGGFTDCMLQNGARLVYAVDVGHGQLHQRLTSDPRVRNLEGIDIREERLKDYIPPLSVDFCSIDVSFISVTKLFDSALRFLKPGADIVCLIKPQFEAGRSAVGKNGVVKDPLTHIRIIQELLAFFQSRGCGLTGLTCSPVTGGSGNIEYLSMLRLGSSSCIAADAESVVREAHRTLKGGTDRTFS